MADLGAVAAGLAHEIRNPLNSLSINSEMLASMIEQGGDDGSGRRDEMLRIARSNLKVADRLSGLLAEFLRYARPPRLEPAPVDLNRVVADTVRFVELDFARRGVFLTLLLHPDPLSVLADDRQLRQALLNLLINAEEALDKEERRIVVETGASRGRPFVRIRDNGRGIAASDKPQLFRLFFTTRRDGTGLGLPIVRHIVGAHGGSVSLTGREGMGATAIIRLPSEEEGRRILLGEARLRALPPGGAE